MAVQPGEQGLLAAQVVEDALEFRDYRVGQLRVKRQDPRHPVGKIRLSLRVELAFDEGVDGRAMQREVGHGAVSRDGYLPRTTTTGHEAFSITPRQVLPSSSSLKR